jgi:hypothetical protein
MKGERVARVLAVILWSAIGGVIMAFIFTSAFLPAFSPIAMGAFQAVILGPLLCGFVVGALLANLEIHNVEYAAILMAIIAMALIFVMMFVPMLTGTAQSLLQLPTSDISRQAMILSSVFLIPFSMMGAVLGKAFGEVALPSDEEVMLRRRLLEETREWHEMLRRHGKEREAGEGEEGDERPPD